MKKVLLLFLFPLCLTAQQQNADLNHLVKFMSGSFNSSTQAQADTNYLNIKLDMVQVWKNRTDGKWLYVEQAINKKDARPYRQRVYHLQQVDEKTFTSTIYKIDSAKKYIGYHEKQDGSLKYDQIMKLEGCQIKLIFDGESYKGAKEKGACKNSWGKASYATSEVEIYNDQLISWDRGWDENGNYVWGAEKAGYIFVKQKSP